MEILSYYSDPYCHEIEATVTSVSEVTSDMKKALKVSLGLVPDPVCAVMFDRTIFYPEGGGQPGDRGFLEVEGRDLVIADTHKLHNNVVHGEPSDGGEDCPDSDHGLGIVPVHFVLCNPDEINLGTVVKLKLDWNHRYSFMQEHTAQHLVSGLLYSMFSIGTVSVHLGQDEFTVEVSEPEVSDEKMLEIEKAGNDAILSADEVSCNFVSHDEAESLGLRRSIKVDTDVRLVGIAHRDCVACGGLHVSRTSECRILLYMGQEKIRGNVRTIWKTAEPAMNMIHEEHSIIRSLCAMQSARPSELVSKVKDITENLTEERQRNSALRIKLAEYMIQSELGGGNPVVAMSLEAGSIDILSFAQAADAFTDLALCVISEGSDKELWLILLKGRYEQLDFSLVRKELLSKIGAKGGGRPPLFQGMAPKMTKAEVEKFLAGFIAMAGAEHE